MKVRILASLELVAACQPTSTPVADGDWMAYGREA